MRIGGFFTEFLRGFPLSLVPLQFINYPNVQEKELIFLTGYSFRNDMIVRKYNVNVYTGNLSVGGCHFRRQRQRIVIVSQVYSQASVALS
jgi:hypothetical protein